MAKKEKQPAAKRPVGRPTKYSLEIATEICEALATSTDSYKAQLERNPHWPDQTTMRMWRYKNEEFRFLYAHARKDQADLFIEEVQERARDRSRDMVMGERGLQANHAAVQRDRLIIDTDKWIACKVLPKIYGDKALAEETAAHTAALNTQLAELLATLLKSNEREY